MDKERQKSPVEFFAYFSDFFEKSFLENFAYNIFKKSNEIPSTKEKYREKVLDFKKF